MRVLTIECPLFCWSNHCLVNPFIDLISVSLLYGCQYWKTSFLLTIDEVLAYFLYRPHIHMNVFWPLYKLKSICINIPSQLLFPLFKELMNLDYWWSPLHSVFKYRNKSLFYWFFAENYEKKLLIWETKSKRSGGLSKIWDKQKWIEIKMISPEPKEWLNVVVIEI